MERIGSMLPVLRQLPALDFFAACSMRSLDRIQEKREVVVSAGGWSLSNFRGPFCDVCVISSDGIHVPHDSKPIKVIKDKRPAKGFRWMPKLPNQTKDCTMKVKDISAEKHCEGISKINDKIGKVFRYSKGVAKTLPFQWCGWQHHTSAGKWIRMSESRARYERHRQSNDDGVLYISWRSHRIPNFI